MSELLYLYGIVSAGAAGRMDGLRGIDGAPLRAIVEAGLAAAVSAVAPAEFESAPLNENVRSASWLEPRAAAHQEVNAALLERTEAVLPLAFGTVFRGEERVGELLRSRTDELEARIARVRGRAEWVVTLERLASVPAAAPQPAAAASGREYLQRRREERRGRAASQEATARARAALETRLREVGVEVAPEPILSGPGPVAGRWSVLLDRSAADGLRRSLEAFEREWSAEGLGARATGPWPPYRTGGA